MTLAAAVARSPERREQVFRFRYRIYVEEMRLSPPDADQARRRLADPLDEFAVLYALFQDGEVIGSLRLVYLADLPDPAPLIASYRLEPGREAFGPRAFCTTGRFMIDPRLRGGRAIFDLMAAGDTFGEIGFLTGEPRTANVVARAPCEMLVLAGPFLQRFVARQPEIGAKVLLNLSRLLAERLALRTRPGSRST